MTHIDRRECVVGFDFDFTLGEFNRSNGLAHAISHVANIPAFVGVDLRHVLEDRVMRMLHGEQRLIDEARRTFDRHVVQRHGARLEESTWSLFARLCALLAERGANPVDYYEQLVDAEGIFWLGVSRDSRIFDGVGALMGWVHATQLPRFVLTSSDARILYESAQNRVLYDLAHSIHQKKVRIAESGLGAHLSSEWIIPSDPHSKETITAWEHLVFPRFPDRQDRSQWVFVGDAPYDMQGALVAGVGTRVFIDRHGHPVPPEATHDVGSIAELHKLLRGLIG